MKTGTIVGVAVAVVVAGGGYLDAPGGAVGWGSVAQDTFGSYAYACDNGAQFTMTPAADMSSLSLKPGKGASFGAVTLVSAASSAGERYEGGGVVFVGVGEEVMLTVGGATLKCNPLPSQEMAPFNWGDAGEGGGVKQDTALIVTESIQGKWQSTDDAKFVREFKAGGTASDLYDGKVVSTGTWKVFTKADGFVYLQMTMQGTQADTLNFKVAKMTPELLQLIYLDRGGVLNFKSIK